MQARGSDTGGLNGGASSNRLARSFSWLALYLAVALLLILQLATKNPVSWRRQAGICLSISRGALTIVRMADPCSYYREPEACFWCRPRNVLFGHPWACPRALAISSMANTLYQPGLSMSTLFWIVPYFFFASQALVQIVQQATAHLRLTVQVLGLAFAGVSE